MSIDPVRLVQHYHAALNRYDSMILASMFREDAIYSSPAVGELHGRTAIIAAFDAYFSEHPDQFAEDDLIEPVGQHGVRCRWRLNATSVSTGESYVRTGSEVVTFDDAGLICRVDVEDS